jgi:glycerate kinase
MKIVIAPDSFKGSLSAIKVAEALARGVDKAYPTAHIVLLPVADGGEGTLDTILAAAAGQRFTKVVTGPLGGSISASFGMLPNSAVGIVEMAQAAGLNLVPSTLRDPRATSTYGVGELIEGAIQEGAQKIIVGLGGSCTNDGGIGAMQALGAVFIDGNGDVIKSPACASDLAKVDKIDISQFRFPVGTVSVVIASDVTNPLCGPDGASAVYAPQKGATAEMVEELDSALLHYANIVERDLGVSIASMPGSGAAGGLGGGLIAFLNAEIRSGIDLVLDTVRFDEEIEGADFVFTGEGRIDEQSLQGKVIAGVMRRSHAYGVPVIAFGASIEERSEDALIHLGLRAVVPIVASVMSMDEAISEASLLLELAAARTTRLIWAG